MGEYRSKDRDYHWSERSLWNPRRWLAAPMVVASAGAVATVVGLLIQALEGGLSWWGGLAALGTLVTVGAIAWTQSDINHREEMRRWNERSRR